jgi:thiosulfate/3-mercaptopyruvate sulfurtransferase
MRKSLGCLTLAAAALLALAATARPQKAAPANPAMLVSTAWLAQHAQDPKVVVLHVGMDKDDYAAGHIPGARFFDMHAVATMGAPGAELPPPAEIKQAFEAAGVSDDTRIVIYAPDWQPQAARVWFALDYIGHGDHAALLDGGLGQWLKEQRPLVSAVPAVKPGTLTLKVAPEKVITFEEVKRLSASGGAVLLDTRPLSRYRVGHIAGAAPIFWERFLVSAENPVLKPPDELRALLAAAGAQPGSTIVPYCEVGYQSSFGYFVARYLGYSARNYDGSISEWRGQKKEALVHGDARR